MIGDVFIAADFDDAPPDGVAGVGDAAVIKISEIY